MEHKNRILALPPTNVPLGLLPEKTKNLEIVFKKERKQREYLVLPIHKFQCLCTIEKIEIKLKNKI